MQEYYTSLESRLGYWILLGNARHCGLWEPNTYWPFPLSRAQRAMEEKLYHRLGLDKGSNVFDAGAGSGLVAAYMAEHGLNVAAVDITPTHVEQAKRNVVARGLDNQVTIELGDYHNLSKYRDESFDGVYTMETFVHADEPQKVLDNFIRLLKPGGVLVLHEADFHWDSPVLREVLRLSHCENTLEEGAYEKMLQMAGFVDIDIEDLSERVLPMWRLFGILGFLPYEALKVLGLQHRLTNVMAGVESYRNWDQGRYISVRATKPLSS